jgi:hypothetical protein
MFEDSPSAESLLDGIPETTSNDPRGRRVAIGILAIIVIGLFIAVFAQRQAFQNLTGTGNVSGVAIDTLDRPAQVEVFVLGTDLSAVANPNGEFEVKNVPAGNQVVVVTYQGMGEEVNAAVEPGETIHLGEIVVQVTLEP